MDLLPMAVFVYCSATLSSQIKEMMLDWLWEQHVENGDEEDIRVLEFMEGNLADLRETTSFPYNICTIVFTACEYGSVNHHRRANLLYPEDAAGLVNDALLSRPEGIVTVIINIGMEGGEGGWKIFFDTISCLERVDFEIKVQRSRGVFAPSIELVNNTKINGFVIHGNRTVYDVTRDP